MNWFGRALMASLLLLVAVPSWAGQGDAPDAAPKPGTGFELRLTGINLNNNRFANYQEGNVTTGRTDQMTVTFNLYGPEGARLVAARPQGAETPVHELTTARDGDGNDLRGPDTNVNLNLWQDVYRGSTAWRPDQVLGTFQITFKTPPAGVRMLRKLEGCAVASQVLEESSVEVKPLKDNLEKDFEAGDAVIRFVALDGDGAKYVISPKDKETRAFFSDGPLGGPPVSVRWFDGGGKQIYPGGWGNSGGPNKRTYNMNFQGGFPANGFARIVWPAKTAEVKIPFSAENVPLQAQARAAEAAEAASLPNAEGYEFRLSNSSLNISRNLNYEMPEARMPYARMPGSDRLSVTLSLFGPGNGEAAPIAASRSTSRSQVTVTAARDGDGNDLLLPNERAMFNMFSVLSPRKDARLAGGAIGSLSLSLKIPPKDSGVLSKLEGYVLAKQVLGQGSLEVKPLKENLDKDLAVGDLRIRFSSSDGGKQINYEVARGEKSEGKVNPRDVPLEVEWTEQDGRALCPEWSGPSDGSGMGDRVRGNAHFTDPFPAQGGAVVFYGTRTADVRLPFSFQNVRIPTVSGEQGTPAPGPDLKAAQGYRFELGQLTIGSNRNINYSGGGPEFNGTEQLSVALNLYGPERPNLARVRLPAREPAPPSAVTAALDGDGNDLRNDQAAPVFYQHGRGPFGAAAMPANLPIGSFRVTLKAPPKGSNLLRKLEGYAVAAQPAEESAVEVKPLKDNLNKDFEAGGAVVRFTGLAEKEVVFALKTKGRRPGMMGFGELPVSFKWFDEDGKEIQAVVIDHGGLRGGREPAELKARFDEPFPPNGTVKVLFVTKTADVKIPFSFENIKLP